MSIAEKIIGGFIAAVGILVFLVLFIAGITLLNAFVFIKLWGWFMIPFLKPCMTTVPPLTYPIAIGITLIISLLFRVGMKKEKEPESWGAALVLSCSSLFVLFMGWIVHLFM